MCTLSPLIVTITIDSVLSSPIVHYHYPQCTIIIHSDYSHCTLLSHQLWRCTESLMYGYTPTC